MRCKQIEVIATVEVEIKITKEKHMDESLTTGLKLEIRSMFYTISISS